MPSKLQDLLVEHAGHAALQFSGGRDSLAMLMLLKPYWGALTVYFCNSGDAFPETLALVGRVKAMVPRFIEVPGYAVETRATYGWPSDVLPSGAGFGWDVYPDQPQLQSREKCCYRSVMLPLQAAMVADKVTLILRGQRESDHPKSPVKHGETVDGFTVFYPINDWSTEEVERFIEQSGEKVPSFYRAGMTAAPVCMHCTGWLEHNTYPYIRKFYPSLAATVQKRIIQIHSLLNPPMLRLAGIAGDSHG